MKLLFSISSVNRKTASMKLAYTLCVLSYVIPTSNVPWQFVLTFLKFRSLDLRDLPGECSNPVLTFWFSFFWSTNNPVFIYLQLNEELLYLELSYPEIYAIIFFLLFFTKTLFTYTTYTNTCCSNRYSTCGILKHEAQPEWLNTWEK
jgi:hypothetical protein